MKWRALFASLAVAVARWLRPRKLRYRDLPGYGEAARQERLIASGALTVNEIRALRGLPPYAR